MSNLLIFLFFIILLSNFRSIIFVIKLHTIFNLYFHLIFLYLSVYLKIDLFGVSSLL